MGTGEGPSMLYEPAAERLGGQGMLNSVQDKGAARAEVAVCTERTEEAVSGSPCGAR